MKNLLAKIRRTLPALLLFAGSIGAQLVPAKVLAQTAPVHYTVSPSSAAVKPGDTVNVTVSIVTDVDISGASVNLTFGNSSYGGGFTQVNEPAAMQFIDYKSNYNDLLFICNNNRCTPGTYKVATISVKVGSSGTATVVFAPKETFDPAIQPVAASGTTATYQVDSAAPPNNNVINGNTYVVPGPADEDSNNVSEPSVVSEEEFTASKQRAYTSLSDRLGRDSDVEPDNEDDSSVQWSRLLKFGGIALGSIALSWGIVYLVLFILRRGGSSGPPPTSTGGSGTPPPPGTIFGP